MPSYGGYPPPSRPRRVEGGMRVRSRRGAIGETWWSQRFIGVLESFGMGSRLTRGRAYARSGQVLDVAVAAGSVVATVQGSRRTPYRVLVKLKVVPACEWGRVERVLAEQALYSAKLLSGEMPSDVEDVFAGLGLSLFPASGRELSMECSCPDWAVPCKHIAATFYVLAESFDADPFLIFAWRGREKDELLTQLRALRGAGVREEPAASTATWAAGLEDVPLVDCLAVFWGTGEPAVPASAPIAGAVPDLVLRQLDRPEIEVRGRNLVDLLRPAYQVLGASPAVRAAD
jgi:uncharacterized Zn finger protein